MAADFPHTGGAIPRQYRDVGIKPPSGVRITIPCKAADIADTIFWVATLPPHLNINRIELMPTSQSFAGFQVHRGA